MQLQSWNEKAERVGDQHIRVKMAPGILWEEMDEVAVGKVGITEGRA